MNSKLPGPGNMDGPNCLYHPNFIIINKYKMKRMKFILPLVAIMLIAAGVWAMHSIRTAPSNADPQTWYYIGPSTQTTTELNTASNYSPNNPGGDCLSQGTSMCSIFDVPASNGTEPELSHGTVDLNTPGPYNIGFRH